MLQLWHIGSHLKGCRWKGKDTGKGWDGGEARGEDWSTAGKDSCNKGAWRDGHTRAHRHTHTNAHTHTHRHTQTQIHKDTHRHAHTYSHTQAQTHTQTHIHTDTHIAQKNPTILILSLKGQDGFTSFHGPRGRPQEVSHFCLGATVEWKKRSQSKLDACSAE